MHLTGQLEKAAGIMCLAVDADSSQPNERDIELARLRTENDGLRQLLGIAGIPASTPIATPLPSETSEA